ncbi:Xaa-Pro dipeptidyl-peptidase [Pediococcus inopinatus]|uniref:Xaa-Pro dipeptidyl-peptidase n=1 Tax=Pediococcus inopinatus TaxID=114090 RepID=UPI002B260D07|nr:Xaa-Pro dipeptidyl-peptidase [Pediococcus inopinatus]WPC17192.1 Xaa-Pro dipeptidyl-peptidase [Pediococcus inopinatus]
MKNNQFAIEPVDRTTELKELRATHFIDDSIDQLDDPIAVWQELLHKTVLEAKSQTVFKQKLNNYLATPEMTLGDFLDSQQALTNDIFYRVAMQLLEFDVDIDFKLDNPIEAMKQIKLPIVGEPIKTKADLLHAWYLLLCTHTKKGQTYLDKLAQAGYFVSFYATTTKPLFFNGKAQAVFDPHQLIRDVVYVEAPLDTDEDGKRDLLKVEILRPKQTADDYRAPVLYTASPYNQGINGESGSAAMHNVDVPLEPKKPNQLTYADIHYQDTPKKLPAKRKIAGEQQEADETFAMESPYTLNDYFLTRGFAVVYAAGIGTKDSDGIRDTGAVSETVSTIAVIEWLAGNRTAFTNKTDNIEIKASWSNGKIAMTGRSYLGTLAVAAATTGVDGLKTVVSEAAISSWYDYYRDGGLVAAPDTFQGEDMDVLATEVFSRMQKPGDYLKIKDFFNQVLQTMTKDQDRQTGNYSHYWDERNYVNNVKNIKADMIMVHGLNDWNVKPRNVGNLWNALRDAPITKKLILHQGQHIYVNGFRSLDFTDMMNLWFSHELFGLDNHAEDLLPDVLIQDNVQPETWTSYEDWQAPTDQKQVFNFEAKELVPETVPVRTAAASFSDHLDPEVFDFYKKHLNVWERDLLTTNHDTKGENQLRDNRLIFKTSRYDHDTYIDGCAQLKIRVAVNEPFGMLSFQLVDYGDAKRLTVSPTILAGKSLSGAYDWRRDNLREFTLQKEATPWKMITKGHINLQNRHNAYQVDELKANDFYDLTVDLQPTFYHLLAGHQLGLVVYATDFATTVRGNQELQYSLQINQCKITLPIK